MGFEAVVTDLEGRELEGIDDHDGLRITPRLNGHVEVALTIPPSIAAAASVAVARRALKVYDDGVLRFRGQIWEPLDRRRDGVSIAARSPLAAFAWRRVQTVADYVATDAGAIARNRVDVQNARRATYLRATVANTQASVARTRTYNPGKREDEILDELADAADGFYYYETFVEDASVMADLLIRYPNAGTSRPEVRFEYGDGTDDNVSDYSHIETLPKTSFTAAGGQDGGGRITAKREDAAAITTYGLFEDEAVFSEQADATLLAQAATAEVRVQPVLVVQITPGPDSPLLYRDFSIGDFVRVRIYDPPGVNLDAWARVAEATMAEDKDSVRTLEALTFELQTGQVDSAPHRWFRDRLDDERRRLEALERRVETIIALTTDPVPTSGSGGGGEASDTPAAPAGPTSPVPTPTPPAPPDVANLTANGWSTRQIRVSVDVDGKGLPTETFVTASSLGVERQRIGPLGTGRLEFDIDGLARNTEYTIRVWATSSAGADEETVVRSTLNVDPV